MHFSKTSTWPQLADRASNFTDLLHRPTRKPKSKKVNLLSPAGVLATVGSTGVAKDALDGTEDDDKKRKSVEDHSEAVKKRRTDVRSFHPELEQMIESLKAAIAGGEYNPRTSLILYQSNRQNRGSKANSLQPSNLNWLELL